MLTKDDLKQIAQVVRVEAQKVVQEETPGIVQSIIQKELQPVKQDLKKVRQDQNSIIKFFDESYLDLRQRVERLEEVVGSLTSR